MSPDTANPILNPVSQIIVAAERLAPGQALSRFAAHLYEGADAAQLLTAGADALARIAAESFAVFARRKPGELSIRIAHVMSAGPGGQFSVIDIANDDMPFLLDSALAAFQDEGIPIKLAAHPILRVRRRDDGELIDFAAADLPSSGGERESFIHLHVQALAGEDDVNRLSATLHHVFAQVRNVATDGEAMHNRLLQCIESCASAPPPLPLDLVSEVSQFLQWASAGNFMLLGARSYDFAANDGMGELRPLAPSGLGVLRDPAVTVLRRGGGAVQLTAESREFFLSPEALIFTTANARSEVYRRAHMDSIGVKRYSASGQLTGEDRFVGFFSPAALSASTRSIPLIRLKAETVLRRSGFASDSHSGKALIYVLETFPRGELLQISAAQLGEFAAGILQLDLNPRSRVFVREDEFGRYVSALVYIMRDRFNTAMRQRVCDFLANAYGGALTSFTPFFTDGPMVRLHIVIWRGTGDLPRHAQAYLEAEVEKIARTWRDELRDRLSQYYGEAAQPKAAKYLAAFPAGYEETNRPSRAMEDIERLESLTAENPTAIDIFSDGPGEMHNLRATLHQLDEPIELSRRVPILENLGFKVISERTFELSPVMAGERRRVFLHDSVIETANGEPILFTEHEGRLEAGFLAVWRGKAANDGFNGLMLSARLNWREAALMRAYAAYLRQTSAPFGQVYLAQTLNRHGGVVADLAAMFHILFDPGRGGDAQARQESAAPIATRIEAKLELVAVLDEDRVLRHFLNLIQSTLRTNYYQRAEGGGAPNAIVLKFRSAKVDGLPAPKPYAEIFVTSPRFEGVHLRGGPIARGGLRWSDRAQDFRTEVLSLAKAQQVKNTVIVPQGAKGGFVPRALPDGDRDAVQAEGVACYKAFIASLLSVTDNLAGGAPSAPAMTVRHDGDDPYLVVAADKGTATFSDIANGIAVEKGFWLGDAFASGGSAGYDHKKMAITARGAWEAVKRHFREMDIDIQTTPFRAAGVGDMSGDVFGNGMLLSKAIKLVAAFDHRDIFIDPDPDPASSWEERRRMFDLPRSSWQDYNAALISPGGGVFSRSAKAIALPAQAQALLGLPAMSAPGPIMNAILRLDADLLWFGGIGTFVRGAGETNEQAGDRANDAIRVTAGELRAKVIGEGANLGLTQRARVEFAQNGGRLNTDAIDNSAGVNSSDFEVNIKIALGAAMARGALTLEERNAFMAGMTDQVADAVLRNNYLQSLAISLGEARGAGDLGFQRRLMQKFEASGLLDRKLEGLPSDAEIAERRQKTQALTRPELAVLLAYSKIDLKSEILASAVPDDAYLGLALTEYFPAAMRERFAADIASHPLRREIIATVLTNGIINRGGSTFAVRLSDETGHEPETIAYAFAAAMSVFRLGWIYDGIDALDGKLDGRLQLALYQLVQDRLRQTTAWFMRYGRFERGLTAEIALYRSGVERIAAGLPSIQSEAEHQALLAERERLAAAPGIAPDLARDLAELPVLAPSLEVVLAAQQAAQPETAIGRVFFDAQSYFRLSELRARSEALGRGDHFDRLAVNGTLEAVSSVQRAIVASTAAMANGAAPEFAYWLSANGARAERVRRNVSETLDAGDLTLAKLTVAAAHLRDLA